jgi:hypothetical protein
MVKLPPQEAMLIQRVHAAIAAETWFNSNAITQTELLKLILTHHAAGETQEAALLLLCRNEARERFSRTR